MINPHWSVVDLDPVTWRAIGEFISPGRYVRAGESGEHALYVLHDNGRVLNIVDTESGRRTDIDPGRIVDPDAVASDLLGRGEWDRVHLVDRQHLRAVAHEAQSSPRHDLTLDAYYRLVSHLMWSNSDSRYVVAPPRETTWNGWTYGGVLEWIESLPNPATIALGVVGATGLRIGVIAQLENGLINVLTTFESLRFPREDAEISEAYRDRLWHAIDATFAPAVALLLCTDDVFDRWIHEPNKADTINAAVASGAAFIRFGER
jgi:hypothetical protein